MKNYVQSILFIVLILSSTCYSQTPTKFAGFRASRILQSYPNNQFPNAKYWERAGNFIASKFSDAEKTGIWIVSLYIDNGETQVNFPSPGGYYSNISFLSYDQNESYLKHFDTTGVKIWLQVEPGGASVDTLIHIVLNRYKNHSCVVGFGVDVEWYNAHLYSGGGKITDAVAKRWENKVKSINPNYSLFLKHYSPTWMPPAYRGNILFVDDSQDFGSMSYFLSEFKSWGNKFKPNKVAFQFGYPKDKVWWSVYSDPVKKLGDTLFKSVSNCAGVFWVDFTINQVYPITAIHEELPIALNFDLYQNYPNPFNPVTTIAFSIPSMQKVTLKVYDILGNEVSTLIDKEINAGSYSTQFDASQLASGIYFYTLRTENYLKSKKMMLIK